MSDLQGKAIISEVALTAATAKTVAQIVAPANHRVILQGWSVFFDGTAVTNEPVIVEVLFQTSAGTMTPLTLVKTDGSLPETLQTTGQHTATVEPSSGDVIARKNIHPQAGFEKIFPLGQEPKLGGGDRIGIRCTAPDAVNVVAELTFEE